MTTNSNTLAEVVEFFSNHYSQDGTVSNQDRANATWQERIQPRLAHYLADLMQAAEPYAEANQEQYDNLMRLCGQLLTQHEQTPASPQLILALHNAVEGLGAASVEFRNAAALAGRNPIPDHLRDEAERSNASFWKKLVSLTRGWKADMAEYAEEQERRENEDPHKETKDHLLDNFLGPAGPLLRVAREVRKEYGLFFGGIWYSAKKRWRFLRSASVNTRRAGRKIRASMLKLFKWLSRPLRNVASRIWNKIKKWGGKLLNRLPMGRLGRLRALGGVASKLANSKAFKFGLVALAGVGISAMAHASPQQAVPEVQKPDDVGDGVAVDNMDGTPPVFVPNAQGDIQSLGPSEQMPWSEDESDSPEGPFEFEPGAPLPQADAAQPTATTKPNKTGAAPKPDPGIDKAKMQRDMKDSLKFPDADKTSKNLEGLVNEQGELTKQGIKEQQRTTATQTEATSQALPQEDEMKKKQNDSGGFFSRMWNMLTGKTAGASGQSGGSSDSQATTATPVAPAASASSGGGDGADTGGAAKQTVAKASPAAASKSVGGGENVERGKKATTRASGSVDLERVNPGFMRNFYAMVGEYNAKTGRRVQVNSGYRSKEQQAALRAKYGSRAAPPGLSMHEFGYAIDINSSSGNELDRMGLLQKYGFVRPVRGEAWHIEQADTQANKAAIRAGKQYDIADRSGESPGQAAQAGAEREVEETTAKKEEAQAKTKVADAKAKGAEKRKETEKTKVQQAKASADKKAAVEQQAPNSVPKTEEAQAEQGQPTQLAEAQLEVPPVQPTDAMPPEGYVAAGRQEILAGLQQPGNPLSNPSATPAYSSGLDFASPNMQAMMGRNPQSMPDVFAQGQGILSQVDGLPNMLKDKASSFLSKIVGQQNADALTQLANPLLDKAQQAIGQFTAPASQAIGQVQNGLPSFASGQGLMQQMVDRLGLGSAMDTLRNPIERMRQQIDPYVRPVAALAQPQPDSYTHIESVGAAIDKTVDLAANDIPKPPKQKMGGGSIDIGSVPLYIGDMAFLHLNLGIGGR